MKISIFGLGYVGSVSAACFASMGHEVIGVDFKSEKNNIINSGRSPVYEKGLDKLIKESVENKKLFATDDIDSAVNKTEISLVCVGTPSSPEGQINLNHVINVCKDIAISLKSKKSNHIILIRSTIVPGTIENKLFPLVEKYSGKESGKDFSIIMNPEFLREGSAIDDFFNPERIVVGAKDLHNIEKVRNLYKGNNKYQVQASFHHVPIKLAEMIKFTENSYHALKVAFANEIGVICKSTGVDSQKLMELFCKDKKLNLSSYYFRPGFSFGGSCLPKDLKGLNAIADDFELKVPLLNSIEVSNQIHTGRAIKLIKKTKCKKIGFIGISFKVDTDDIRENPIIEVIKSVSKNSDCSSYLYDDKAKIDDLFSQKNIHVEKNIDTLIKKVEVLVFSNYSKRYESMINNSDCLIIDLNRSISNSYETLTLV